MKQLIKRLTAMILAVCMCMSFVCAQAWAAESGTEQSDESAATVSEEAAEAPEAEQDSAEEAEVEVPEDEETEQAEEAPEPDESEEVAEREDASASEWKQSGKMKTKETLSTQEVASGTCGDNLTWTLDEEGTLTISGTGEMPYWMFSRDRPWNDYQDAIKTVIIQMGATSIGNYAFSGCSSLNSISIPTSVTSIGIAVFDQCGSLSNISIPTSVTSIGDSAFSGCSSLSSISIPTSVTSIGDFAFSGCSSLSSISIPTSVTSIGGYAFSYCSSLSNISIPTSVTSIREYMFVGCSSLSSISIPTGVTSIDFRAFARCSNLSSISIPTSVTKISAGAFYGCSSLNSISIPTGVTIIGDDAFSGCNSLTIRGLIGSRAQSYASENNIPFEAITTPLSSCDITLSSGNYAYDGNAKEPPVTVKYEGNTLTNGTDYTVSYSNNVNPGTATVTVTGMGSYTGTVTRTFTISKAAPTLYFSNSSITKSINDTSFTNSLTKTTDGAITYSSSNTGVATVDNSGQVTIVGEGTTTITATATEGKVYSSGSASYTLTVQRLAPTLTFFSSSMTRMPGDETFANPLDATTDGTITYSSSNTSVATVDNSGWVTIIGEGTTTITAAAAAGTKYSSGSASYTLTVTRMSPTLSFASTSITKTPGDSPFTNPIRATTDGTITYSSSNTSVATVNSSGQVTIIGEGTTTITATAAAGTKYSSGSASYTLIVQKQAPTLRFSSSSVTKTYGDTPFTNSLTKTTDGTVTYSSGNTSVATVNSSGQVTIKGAGSTTITATAAASVNYASSSASYTLTVQKAQPMLRFASSSVSKTYGDSAFTNTLTKTTDGTVTYSSSDAGVATVNSNGQVTINDTGSTTITVTATEGANYNSGSASYTLTVYKASSVLKFASSTIKKTYGDGSFTNTLTNKSKSSVRYSSSDTSVATVNSYGTVTIVGAGTTSITASVSTDDNFDSGVAYYTLTVEKAKNKVTASNIKKTASGSKLSFKIGAKAKGGAEFDYKCSEKSVDISDAGKVTVPAGYAGKFTVTIKAEETDNYHSASKKITVEIVPPKVSLKGMSSPQKGWIKVEWKAAKGISGYQFQVSESKDFKTGKQKKSNLSAKEKDVTMSGLKSKKTYYARLRTYKKNGSKTYYGEWSKAKAVKVK